MKGESRQERFKRIAEKRVQNILENIRKLSQCSNKKLYEWDTQQLNKIWKAIDSELNKCKSSYENPDSDLFKL